MEVLVGVEWVWVMSILTDSAFRCHGMGCLGGGIEVTFKCTKSVVYS